MTFEQVQNVVQSTTFNGFPLILDRETYRLCGYVLRRDLLLALRNAQEINPNVVCQSKVYFKSEIPYDETQNNMGGPSALKLHRIVEWSPFQITVQGWIGLDWIRHAMQQFPSQSFIHTFSSFFTTFPCVFLNFCFADSF